jgi:predicted ABC-type ATPase
LPVLSIIAGPNGAGKSTHSNELLTDLEIEAFDFDKEFYSIWSQFDFDPSIEQGAFDRAQKLYTDRRTNALEQKQNFAFETNYHTKHVFSVIEIFQSSGYKIELIFICLESADTAIERVKDRVAKGGHSVDEMTIRERFKNGLDLAVLILEPHQNKVTTFAPIPTVLTAQFTKITQFVISNS